MLLQTNSYIVPKEKRVDHARVIRRFRQVMLRLGCDQFEVYEQVGANWAAGEAHGRFVQIMRFRDRRQQQAVQAAEREDPSAQKIIAEFCDLINFPYQQQNGYFAVGFYNSVLPVGGSRRVAEEEYEAQPAEAEYGGEDAAAAGAAIGAAAMPLTAHEQEELEAYEAEQEAAEASVDLESEATEAEPALDDGAELPLSAHEAEATEHAEGTLLAEAPGEEDADPLAAEESAAELLAPERGEGDATPDADEALDDGEAAAGEEGDATEPDAAAPQGVADLPEAGAEPIASASTPAEALSESEGDSLDGVLGAIADADAEAEGIIEPTADELEPTDEELEDIESSREAEDVAEQAEGEGDAAVEAAAADDEILEVEVGSPEAAAAFAEIAIPAESDEDVVTLDNWAANALEGSEAEAPGTPEEAVSGEEELLAGDDGEAGLDLPPLEGEELAGSGAGLLAEGEEATDELAEPAALSAGEPEEEGEHLNASPPLSPVNNNGVHDEMLHGGEADSHDAVIPTIGEPHDADRVAGLGDGGALSDDDAFDALLNDENLLGDASPEADLHDPEGHAGHSHRAR